MVVLWLVIIVKNKTLVMLKEHDSWLGIKTNLQDILRRCATYKVAKSHSLPHGLYTPLPAPTLSWVDVSMEFVLG